MDWKMYGGSGGVQNYGLREFRELIKTVGEEEMLGMTEWNRRNKTSIN